MSQIKWVPLQIGGQFIKGNSNVFTFSDATDFQDDYVAKIQAPNLTTKSQYVTLAYTSATAGSFNKKPFFRSSVDGTWIQESSSNKFTITDTQGLTIVMAPKTVNGVNCFTTYLCKDDAEKLLIPEYGMIPVIETRVASSITTTNFASWRRQTSSTTDCIVLTVNYINTPVNDESKTYFDAVIAMVEGDKIRITTSTINSLFSSNSDLTLPVIGQTYKTGSTIIYDLDERLTILEGMVADQGQIITQLQADVQAISIKIVDIGTAGSLYFVSR